MDMPNAIGLNVTIYPDGRVVEYLGSGGKRIVGTAVSLPEKHGRLIDGDELADGCDAPHWCRWLSEIEDMPTIVEAEGE
jgi:hypothetical protein